MISPCAFGLLLCLPLSQALLIIGRRFTSDQVGFLVLALCASEPGLVERQAPTTAGQVDTATMNAVDCQLSALSAVIRFRLWVSHGPPWRQRTLEPVGPLERVPPGGTMDVSFFAQAPGWMGSGRPDWLQPLWQVQSRVYFCRRGRNFPIPSGEKNLFRDPDGRAAKGYKKEAPAPSSKRLCPRFHPEHPAGSVSVVTAVHI